MTDPDFPEALRSLIQEAIPSVDAAELLLALYRSASRALTVRQTIDEAGVRKLPEQDARRYLSLFASRGLLAGDGESYRYAPVNEDLDAAVAGLARAYNERPVTLVRTIYAPKDDKIRSFADAFRLKK
ncbi:MAG TPA: hypothetical protein VED01_23380 [Burkholderiales bacterium]|nr:hypothetical protein [Burkholderiales bacterium]